jgi:hypothetical protein
MDELVSKHQYRLVCAHVGPAGHDRCITVGVSYFPGDVDKVPYPMQSHACKLARLRLRTAPAASAWNAIGGFTDSFLVTRQ